MDFILALGYFTALAGLFLRKLIPLWNHAVPGGLEDTRLFLWNAWWFHYAVTVLHTNPFHTAMLFHPFGCRLISHDFPLWMNLITFAGQKAGLSMVSASNVWFALTWILLGFCTYGLAREVTGKPTAAIAAGTLAMTHSYTLARAMQNWGQFNVYGIALFLWCLVRARRRKTTASFALAGLALAWTAACHYYFLIYSVLIWLAVVFVDLSPIAIHVKIRRRLPGALRPFLLILATACGLVSMGIAAHPGVYHAGAVTLSMQNPDNLLFIMWIFLMLWASTYLHFDLTKLVPTKLVPGTTFRQKEVPGTSFYRHLVLVGTAALLLTPLFWESFRLIQAGGYPKQSILWKTHLPGANLFALFMPNPLQALWGSAISHWFTARLMNPQEQAASIGWVCLAVVVMSKLWKAESSSRRWLGLALAATVLAMGTHLHLAQYNLWCPLPFFWFRLLPVLGNVRVPERWMAVGAVAWSVALALALTRVAVQRGWPLRKLSLLATLLILAENWPGIPFSALAPVSPLYEHLRDLPSGAVLPIPLYIGDSSIGSGNAIGIEFVFPWDHLWAQVAHQKPMVGGYIGRIPRSLIDRYQANPFTRTLLALEENKPQNPTPEPGEGARAVHEFSIRYVLVYPGCTDPVALQYVLGSLPLDQIDHADGIDLYRVRDYRSD